MNETENSRFEKNYRMGSFLLYVLPTMITFVYNGFYSFVDGAFIEEFQGPYSIAAVNLYYPVLSLTLGLGCMIGVGGSVALAAFSGEGKKKEADGLFSQILLFTVILGVILAVLGNLFSGPIISFLGATEGNIAYALPYYRIMISCSPVFLFASVLLPLFLAEGKSISIAVTSVLGGILNLVLDYVLMGALGMGIEGAALSTILGYGVSCVYALIFYMPRNKKGSSFHFAPVKPVSKTLFKACYNGVSEMIVCLASGVTALIMNHLAFRFYREVGVSVVSVYLYVQFLVLAVFMGITEAVQPLLSYRYGKGDLGGGRRIINLAVSWTIIFSVLMSMVIWFLRKPIVGLFFEMEGEDLIFHETGVNSLVYIVPACLICGFNILITGVFTAYLNGTVSAILSILRTLVFFVVMMYTLPLALGGNGLWLAWFGAEAVSLLVGILFLHKYREKYGLSGSDGTEKRWSTDGFFSIQRRKQGL